MTKPAPPAEIKIEKGIPLPPKLHANALKYPYLQMESGDSFFVAGGKMSSFYSAIKKLKERGLGHFEARVVQGGCRVWCVTPAKPDPHALERAHMRDVEANRKALAPEPKTVWTGKNELSGNVARKRG